MWDVFSSSTQTERYFASYLNGTDKNIILEAPLLVSNVLCDFFIKMYVGRVIAHLKTLRQMFALLITALLYYQFERGNC